MKSRIPITAGSARRGFSTRIGKWSNYIVLGPEVAHAVAKRGHRSALYGCSYRLLLGVEGAGWQSTPPPRGTIALTPLAGGYRGCRSVRPSRETTGRWDVHRYGYFACYWTVVASRPASPPTSPAAHRRSSRATGSCYPSPRRRVSSSSMSRRHWILVSGSKRCASMPTRFLGRVPGHLPASAKPGHCCL
jgi:hypothetical protein